MNPADREALRQQMLLRALWQDARPGVLAGWTRDGEAFTRGLQAYRANAGALAERALAAAYPTVQQLVGEDSFAGLARAYWHQQAPQWGDITLWGAELPAFIAAAEQLAEEPYLADVARLEWAVHGAQMAADAAGPVAGLQALAGPDAPRQVLQALPGTALMESVHPVASIWQAHRATGPDRFDSARQALAQGLINRVVETADLDTEVGRLVESILAKPRAAVSMGKNLFYRQLEKGIEAAYTDAVQTMACNMMEPSALEGVQAFIDKRAPDWH